MSAFEKFFEGCNLILENKIREPLPEWRKYKVEEDENYYKLRDYLYYFAIVDKKTGDVYGPTKKGNIRKGGPRGNIFDSDNGLRNVTYTKVLTAKEFAKYSGEKYPENMS